MKSLRIFKEFFHREGWVYILGLTTLVIIDLLFLLVPNILGKAIDTLSHGKEGLTTYIFYFIGLLIVITFLKFMSRRKLLGSIRKMEYSLRHMICHKALHVSTTYYEKNGPGKVMALMTNDVTSLRVALGLGIMIVVDLLFFACLGSAVLIRKMDFYLAFRIMTPIVFILAVIFVMGRVMRRKQREAQTTYANMTEFVQELFQGMNVVQAFNKEAPTEERFGRINKLNFDKNMTVAFYDSVVAPLTATAPLICLAIGIFVCGDLVHQGRMSVGQFVTINSYIMLIIGPLMGLGSLTTILQKGLASLDRINAFMDLPNETVVPTDERLSLGDIAFVNTTFTYEGSKKPSLDHVNHVVKAGSFVGIVGKPGSGKSTLFKLLLQLQKPQLGQVFINNQDVTAVPLGLLRNSIAYVPSTPYVLSSTIADNISFTGDTQHHITVEEAAKRADLYRDLSAHLEDADKSLKEEGKDLSGGQKQRITIARGLYKDAPYVLLDDCFSALDAITVSHILETLCTARKQTILCISQRLEVVKETDYIIVFDEGRIVDVGTHDALIAKDGLYKELYQAQEGTNATTSTR